MQRARRARLARPRISRLSAAVAAALAFGGPAPLALATDFDWNAATDNWATASNWTPSGPPTSADRAIINNGGTSQVLATGATAGDVYVGSTATGSLAIQGGGALTSALVRIGDGATSTGTVTVSGAGSTWTNTAISVGTFGNGTLEITNGGEVSTSGTTVGDQAGSTGKMTVDGTNSKLINSSAVFVGFNGGNGTLEIKNGGVVSSASTGIFPSIGTLNGGVGKVTVDGAGSQFTTNSVMFVGRSSASTGTLDITNGGAVIVAAGTQSLSLASNVGTTGTINIGAGGAAGILKTLSVIGGSGTATLNFNHTDTAYAFTQDGTTSGAAVVITGTTAVNHNGAGTTILTGANTHTGGTTINAGTLQIGAGGTAGSITGDVVNNGGTLAFQRSNAVTFTGVISGNGSLTQAGTGTLTLSGANTYAGGTTVSAGTLAGTTTSLQGAITNNAKVNFAQTTAGTYAGAMSGTGSVIKSGTGAVTLSGINTYSGGTSVLAGTLSGTTASLQGGFVNNAQVIFDQATVGTYAGVMNGTGSLVKTGTGTVTLSGANNYSGGTTVTAGTLAGTTTSLQRAIVNNATVNFDQATTGTYTGAMSGTGSLVKNGTGTVTLSGANSYSGGTIVTAGTLAGTTTSLQGAIVNNATVNFDQATAGTYAGAMSGTGSLVKNGTGTVTLSGANGYSGGTTVTAGTLAGTTTSLQGAIVNNATINFDQAAAGTYAGAMSGTGSVIKNGTGTVTLSGINTYSGGTTVAAGTLSGTTANLQGNIANNAQVIFDQAAAGTYAGAMSGTGSLIKSGTGALNLTGTNTYTGATTVNGGTLSANGALASTVTVNNGGTLGGSGSISGANVMAGGVFAPGNSIGTMTVNGNVSFAAGSIFRVETDAAGNADRINATGTATISGGTVDVQASAGSYQRNTTYTILNAAGGVTGTFAGATSNLAFLTPSLAYDANNVKLTLTRNDVQLGAVAVTGNQSTVGNYLQTLANDPSIAALVARLEGLTAEQARNAFSSLGGNTQSAGATVTISEARNFMRLLGGRLGNAGAGSKLAYTGVRLASGMETSSDAPAVYAQAGSPVSSALAPGRGFWMQAGGARGNMDGDANATGFTWRGTSFTAGADTELSRDTVVGAAISYGQSNVSPDAGGSGKVKSPRVALYGSHDVGLWQVRGTAGYANQDFDTQRLVVIGNNTSVASGSHRGDEWSASAEAEYTIDKGGYQLKPLAGLRYINLKESGYTETGSIAPLTVAGRTTESIASLLGARYVRAFNLGAGSFEARAIWSHEFGDANPAVSGRLAAAPVGASFTVAGVPIKRDALTLGAGFSSQASKNLSLYADVNAELRGSGQSQYALMGGMRYAW